MSHRLTFAYPGDLALKTGGYGYDRQLIQGLRSSGWDIALLPLGDGFPEPSLSGLREAERRLCALPDGTAVLIDGLAYGVLDDWAARETSRLEIIALVHHPLALESGLNEAQQCQLRSSETRALASAHHIVVTSPASARELISNYDVPSTSITVALPGTEKAPLSPCDGEPPLILSIGTLIPRKAHDVLIKALKQVEDIAWQARIVGSDSLHPPTTRALKVLIDDLGLQDRVHLAGACEDTRALLAKADVFALASRYEGYGMVFAEALSQGLPIVACRGGAIPDVVPDEAGRLVPVDDADAFAAALRKLLEDKALRQRMAKSARRLGQQLPDWTDTARIVAAALESVQ